MADDPLVIAARLGAVFDALRVSYAVGGSLASSLHGVPRATNDIDIVADLRSAHVDRFVSAIEREFHVDAEMIRSAVAERSSFNVFDTATMMKVDVFVAGTDEWVVEELVRARAEAIDVQGKPTAVRFATARTRCFTSSFGIDSEASNPSVSGATCSASSRSRPVTWTGLTCAVGPST